MSKSYKPINSKYINSSSVVYRQHNASGRYNRPTIDEFMTHGSSKSSTYTTHFLQIGYLDCSLAINDAWSTITLLISNTFFNVQHSCSYLVTLAQAQGVSVNALWLQGNTRALYYKIDTTNKRIYLYSNCYGGNGFGYWSATVLGRWNCKWITEVVQNVESEDTWESIPTKMNSDISDKRSKHYICVGKSNSTEPISWNVIEQWNHISMSDVITNTNSSMFSSNNGQITIGSGVSKIRAYGQSIVQIKGWDANKYLFCRISKNNVGVSKAIFSELGWLTLTCEAYIPVSKGDVIRFEVYADNPSTKMFYNYKAFGAGYGNIFTVEAIE